jgi:hypothetical protein
MGIFYGLTTWIENIIRPRGFTPTDAGTLGALMLIGGPIGMQYAAEITLPTPEGTSNSLIQLFGQASVVFVYIMAAMQTADGSFTPSLLLAMALMVLSVLVVTQLRGAPFGQG